MTRKELQTIKEFASGMGLYVNDKSWGFKEMFTIKYTSSHTWSTLLDATYSDFNIIGMPKHFTYRYYDNKGCTFNKKIYDIREISLDFVKKKLVWYASAPKRHELELKQKAIEQDFE